MRYDKRLQIRLDSNLQRQAEAVYEQLGMDLASAIRLFLQQSVVQGGLPFGMMSPAAFEAKLRKNTDRSLLISEARTKEVARTAATCRRGSFEFATLTPMGEVNEEKN